MSDNHLIKLSQIEKTRIQTSRGVVFVIDGISPATFQMIVAEAERRYPTPEPPTVETYLDPTDERSLNVQEIRSAESAKYWSEKEPERWRDLPRLFDDWRRQAEDAYERSANFLMVESIRYGVSVDADATTEAGGSPPDFTLSWRDKSPAYVRQPDGSPVIEEQQSDWSRYLMYAIGNTEDWGSLSAAVLALLNMPTEDGIAVAIELFRSEMAAGVRRLATDSDAPGVEEEPETPGNEAVTMGNDAEGSAGVGDVPG